MSALGSLAVAGQRMQGESVRTQNVMAAATIANMVKSSLGPVGLDKMLVDDVGDVTVTNDGATILSQVEVLHPAAKILVDLAQLQDQEIGDGTTSVVSFLQKWPQCINSYVHGQNFAFLYNILVHESYTVTKE